MRRAPLVITATVAGLAGVLTFHTHAPTTVAVGSSGSSPPSGPGASPPRGTGSPATPKRGAAGSGSAAPATGLRSAVGKNVQFGYGALTVKVTVTGQKITNVVVPSLATAESYSQSIAVQVIPILRGEVLSAQSANINAVTGATYTSQAYAISLQAALDKLHVK